MVTLHTQGSCRIPAQSSDLSSWGLSSKWLPATSQSLPRILWPHESAPQTPKSFLTFDFPFIAYFKEITHHFCTGATSTKALKFRLTVSFHSELPENLFTRRCLRTRFCQTRGHLLGTFGFAANTEQSVVQTLFVGFPHFFAFQFPSCVWTHPIPMGVRFCFQTVLASSAQICLGSLPTVLQLPLPTQ